MNIESIADEIAALAVEEALQSPKEEMDEANDLASIEEAPLTPGDETSGVGGCELENESTIDRTCEAHDEPIEITYSQTVSPSPPSSPFRGSRGSRIKAVVRAMDAIYAKSRPATTSSSNPWFLRHLGREKSRHLPPGLVIYAPEAQEPNASQAPSPPTSFDTRRVQSTPNVVPWRVEDLPQRSRSIPWPPRQPDREHSQRSPEESREDEDSGPADPELLVESVDSRPGECASHESRELNNAQSFADEIASPAAEETDECRCDPANDAHDEIHARDPELLESSGLSPRNADVDAGLEDEKATEDEKTTDMKSDSCHSDSCEPIIVWSSELPVQLTKLQNEEQSSLFVEIGHDLANDDEPTMSGMQKLLSPGTSKDEIEDPPNEGLPDVAEKEIAGGEIGAPSEDGEGGAPAAITEGGEEDGKPSEVLSDAEITGTKKWDLSKGFEVVRIRTGQEEIHVSTRKNNYIALSKKIELEMKERIKAEEAEKARKESDRKAEEILRRARKEAEKEAERIRKEAEKEEKEKKKLKEAAKMDEERFAAKQQRKMAQNDEANFKMSHQRGGSQKRALTPVIETATPEPSSAQNTPTADVKKAPSHRRFKSPLRFKKSTAEDEAEEGEQGTPSSGKAKSPKKQGVRWRYTGRKTKPGTSKPDKPKPKAQPVSKSPSGYIPLAERRSVPLKTGVHSQIRYSSDMKTTDLLNILESSMLVPTSDEGFARRFFPSQDEVKDDVRDEYESSRRGQRGREDQQLNGRESQREHITDKILDALDSFACTGELERLYGGDEPSLGGRSSIEETVRSSIRSDRSIPLA